MVSGICTGGSDLSSEIGARGGLTTTGGGDTLIDFLTTNSTEKIMKDIAVMA